MPANALQAPSVPRKTLQLPQPTESSESVYTPEWTPPFEGYVANHVRRNLWKIERTHDRDDAWQECRWVFYDCCRRYTGKAKNAAHFMALFKMALGTHWIDLAAKASKVRAEMQAFEDEDGSAVDYTQDVAGETQNLGELRTKLRQAPSEVRTVLSLFLNAPAELVELATDTWRAQNRGRKASSGGAAHLNKLLGLTLTADPVALVEAYLLDK